ncbi:nitroreductase family protein [Prevotella sp. KH2C16]|uniref:nitroreductase family protein n=1 Tax=Prevotella sp. KH2C16 TaxID=1855325 RepID=UPI0008E55A25|nr:nitroreductase family protein [Prevotella sp. KH2C16]SFG33279.1 Nitroreductase [Prevotella sp. KH2C16]
MKTRILILALAAALVYVTAMLVLQKTAEPKAADPSEAVYNNILTRTSVRKYQDKKIDDATIEKLLRAGMAAPTAGNRQPWHFVVCTDKEVLADLAAANPNAGMVARAPLAIAVCGDKDKTFDGEGAEMWVQDCSAATENILLAAHGLGLGAVWTGVYPVKDRVSKISKALELPETIVPLGVIAIGHPAEMPAVKQKFSEDNVSYDFYEE